MESAVANPLAVLKPSVVPRLFTLEAYMRQEERSSERHEYYDGTIVRVPMARGPHNIIAMNVGSALKYALKNQVKKYFLYSSNQKIYLPKLNFGLYPDAVAVCENPLYWDDNQVLLINPVLIVEVLSKSTGNYDRAEKFTEYKTLPSFQEYLLIEQNKCRVESRFREEPDLWRDTVEEDPSGSIFLRSVGCTLSLADIYDGIEFPPAPKTRVPRRGTVL